MAQGLPEKRRESTPERWHPFQDLDSTVERMRQMLDETFAGFSRWPARYADIWSPWFRSFLVDVAIVIGYRSDAVTSAIGGYRSTLNHGYGETACLAPSRRGDRRGSSREGRVATWPRLAHTLLHV